MSGEFLRYVKRARVVLLSVLLAACSGTSEDNGPTVAETASTINGPESPELRVVDESEREPYIRQDVPEPVDDRNRTAIYPSGTIAWHSPVRGTVQAMPIVVEGIAYVATTSGDVYGFRVANGEEAFHGSTGHAFYASPVVTGEVITWLTREGSVVSLDTGSHTLDVGNSLSGGSQVIDSFVIVGDMLVYAIQTEAMTAVSRKDLRPIWSITFGGGNWITGLIADETLVYYRERTENGCYVTAVSLDFGELIWRFRTKCGSYVAPPIAAGTEIVATIDEFGRVVGLSKETGLPRWLLEESMNGGLIWNGDDDFFALVDGGLSRLRSGSGRTVWVSPHTGGVLASDDVLYVSSHNDGTLYGLDADSGQTIWGFKVDAPLSSSLAKDGRRLIVAANDIYGAAGPYVIAIEPPDELEAPDD
jgi:outer membrane protein assembly factor BamB